MTDSATIATRHTQSTAVTVFPEGCDPLTPIWQTRLLWAFLCLGIAARAFRYLLCFPLWEDECFLCFNLGTRDFAGLMRPLDYHQVAPLLFLWAELAVVKVLGFSEMSLRLLPFLCGIASLLLFRHLAGRLLQGTALVMAVGIFAVAYPAIRYSAEAKQYSTDLFFAIAMIAMAIEWRRGQYHHRWLWALTALVPMALGFSYPAVFVAGGISLYTAAAIWQRKNWSALLPWASFNIVLIASFVGWLLLVTQSQAAAELDFMTDYWQNTFPPTQSVLAFAKWLVVVHASDLTAYPVGGAKGASVLTLLGCLAAVVLFWRQQRREWLILLLAPLGLNLLAAALHRYPYGGHAKFAQYAAPAICLLAGLGAAMALANHLRRNPRDRWLLRGLVGALMLIAIGSMARDFAYPFKSRNDQRARDFARWFWTSAAHDGQAVCVHRDLGQNFSPTTYEELNWSAMYFCNQRIYSARHAAGQPPRLAKVSADQPLRCVLYQAAFTEPDPAAVQNWINDMRARYSLASHDTYAFPFYTKREDTLITTDHLDIYRFVPKAADASVTAQSEAGLRSF